MDSPAIVKGRPLDRLAHGLAAEHGRLYCEKDRICRKRNFERALECAAIEKNGLLRQPIEPGSGAERDAGLDRCRRAVERSIDLVAGLSGDDSLNPRRRIDAPDEAIATRHSSGGIDENGLGMTSAAVWQPNFRGTFLIEPVETGGGPVM